MLMTANIGQVIRDAQLNLFEQRDATFLARCRAIAADVCRQQGSVSINDVRERIQHARIVRVYTLATSQEQ